MKLHIEPTSVGWWLWAVTLAFLASGLLGWRGGFGGAIVVSLVQVAYYAGRLGSLAALESQVRVAYLLLAVLFWLDPTRVLYGLMFLSTVLVVFFDRCVLAVVLKRAPWNRGREASG